MEDPPAGRRRDQGRPGRALAQLPRARRRARRLRGRSRLHPHRALAGDGAPVRRLVGLPGVGLLRADQPLRHARRPPLLHRLLPPEGPRRDPRLDAGALPQGRLRPRPLRRERALRAHRSAPGRAQAVEHLRVQLRPPRGQNFLISNALYWLEEFHVDGLHVDAVASMLYLDYGSSNAWGRCPTSSAAARTSRPWPSCASSATPSTSAFGAVLAAEESTSWPGVTRATYLGGLGFDLSGTWGGCTTPWPTSASTPSTATSTTAS